MYQNTQFNSYFDLKYKYTPVKTVNLLNYWYMPKNSGYLEAKGLSGITEEKSYLGSNPIDELMGEKRELLRSNIEMILSGIEVRRSIKQENLYRIDKDSCDCTTMILQMPFYRRYGFHRERMMIEKMKKDLESQKRMEEVNYFRDLAFLQKDLKDTIIEYLSERNKQSLVSGLEQ